MQRLVLFAFLFVSLTSNSQSVGIGTTTPNTSSVLDLGPSAKPVILPRLTTAQMNAVTKREEGMTVFNTDENQIYTYMKYRINVFPAGPVYKWQPISTGPRMLAWGVVDSFAITLTGGGTHSVTWDATNNWYKMALSNPHEYYKDSMLLLITAVGNGSWDQAISTGEIIEGSTRFASIKFTDISRIHAEFSALNTRRRSGFHFVLYDLRKKPY